jgi:DNA-binding XRE family transcriptional regulator
MNVFIINTMKKIMIERAKQGIKQWELADKVGIDKVTLCAIERGRQKASDATLVKIATELGLDPEFFMEE